MVARVVDPPPGWVPPERVVVDQPERNCVFEPPGPSVVLDHVAFERVVFEDTKLVELLVTGGLLLECTFRGDTLSFSRMYGSACVGLRARFAVGRTGAEEGGPSFSSS
jgi:hypothetical protein